MRARLNHQAAINLFQSSEHPFPADPTRQDQQSFLTAPDDRGNVCVVFLAIDHRGRWYQHGFISPDGYFEGSPRTFAHLLIVATNCGADLQASVIPPKPPQTKKPKAKKPDDPKWTASEPEKTEKQPKAKMTTPLSLRDILNQKKNPQPA